MTGLPAPYGSGALEPPDEPPEDPDDYLPAPTGHREGERVNWASYCVECGEPWPCDASEAQGRRDCQECN